MTLPIGSIQQFASSFGPWFLRNRHVGAFLESVALVYDTAVQSLDLGLRLSQPLRCDPSALPVLGYDRGIPFYPGEPEDSKRLRLSQWLQLHRTRGTHYGELKHAQPYFMSDYTPTMRIVHQDGNGSSATWHTLYGDGSYVRYRKTPSNWNWDGRPSQWSRFWVLCYAPPSFSSLIRYGDGSRYADGSIYAGGASHQIDLDLIGMIRDWKSAHSRLAGYAIVTDTGAFSPGANPTTNLDGSTTFPTGNWGQPLSAAGVRTRNRHATWIYDLRNT